MRETRASSIRTSCNARSALLARTVSLTSVAMPRYPRKRPFGSNMGFPLTDTSVVDPSGRLALNMKARETVRAH